MAFYSKKDEQQIITTPIVEAAPKPVVKDDSREKVKAAQAAQRAAEQRADELAKQLSTATLEIMRLKAEVYDLQHGLA